MFEFQMNVPSGTSTFIKTAIKNIYSVFSYMYSGVTLYHTYGSTRAILSINKVTMSNSVIHFDGMLYSVIHVTIYNGVVQILSLVHVCFLFFVNGIVINKVICFLVSIISPFFHM